MPTQQENSWAKRPVLAFQKFLWPLLENEPQFLGRLVHPLSPRRTLTQLRGMAI